MSIDITPTTILAPFEAEHKAVNLIRNTKGSAWNKVGNNKLIDTDQWRYNYNPATGIFEGRTIMGQWTNEILDPRDMTTGNWAADDTSKGVVARDAVGIDGQSNTATSVEDNDTGETIGVRQDFSIADDSNTHSFTVFVKKDSVTSRFVGIEATMFGGTTQTNVAHLNTSDGSVTFTISDNASVGVENLGNYWRVDLSVTNNGTGNTTLACVLFPAHSDSFGSGGKDGNSSATGSAVFDVAQVFLNHSSPPPTPVYGETAGQSYTQDPDIATVTDLDAINFNPDEGTFIIEEKSSPVTNNTYILHDTTVGSDKRFLQREGDGRYATYDPDSGTFNSISSAPEGVHNKVAVAFDGTTVYGCVNGGTVGTNTFIYDDSIVQLDIGHISKYNGFIKELKYYSRRLSNDQLQQETL